MDAKIEQLKKITFPEIPVRRDSDGVPRHVHWPDDSRPNFGGIYCFWWHRGADDLFQQIENPTVAFHGPGGEERTVTVQRDHFREIAGKVPLYVGKNHGGEKNNLANRIGLHLKLKTPRVVPRDHGHEVQKRLTTTCQVRDRLDRLFDETDDTRELILQNLSLSFVREDDWITRFFLEDLAIGLFRPLFNLDCER